MTNILQSHTLRTKLADKLVNEHTFLCASELIEGIQKIDTQLHWPTTLKTAFGIDDEQLEALRYVRDHEETFNDTVDDADDIETLSQICAVAGLVWDDICAKQVNDTEFALDKVQAVIKAEPNIDYVAFCNNYEDLSEQCVQEILEHWIVDNTLARKLRERGESVVEVCGLPIWGRTTSGQAIAMDSVIQHIAFDLYNSLLPQVGDSTVGA